MKRHFGLTTSLELLSTGGEVMFERIDLLTEIVDNLLIFFTTKERINNVKNNENEC